MPESFWQSTGLYAAPGTVVTVTLLAAIINAAAGKVITLQIGCHTDSLWNKSPWVRLPVVVRRYTATTATTTIGSALGGLIYVILPSGLSLGMQDITISGGLWQQWVSV
jgi:hypothetical protein